MVLQSSRSVAGSVCSTRITNAAYSFIKLNDLNIMGMTNINYIKLLILPAINRVEHIRLAV